MDRVVGRVRSGCIGSQVHRRFVPGEAVTCISILMYMCMILNSLSSQAWHEWLLILTTCEPRPHSNSRARCARWAQTLSAPGRGARNRHSACIGACATAMLACFFCSAQVNRLWRLPDSGRGTPLLGRRCGTDGAGGGHECPKIPARCPQVLRSSARPLEGRLVGEGQLLGSSGGGGDALARGMRSARMLAYDGQRSDA